MALNLMCSNSGCVHYFEDNCIKHLNDERIILDENGKCETFEEGICEGYRFAEKSEGEEVSREKIDWCHSSNGEYFNSDTFETREECIKDATENYGYTIFYIGNLIEYMPCIDIDVVLERLNEEACEQCGEYAEDYLYHVRDKDKNELSDQLNAVFQAWAKKTGNEPTFFTVENVERTARIKADCD